MYVDGVLYSYQDQWYIFNSSPGISDTALDIPFIEIYDQDFKFENLGTEVCGNEKCHKYKLSGGSLENDYVELLFSVNDYIPNSLTTYLESGEKIYTTIEYKDIIISVPKNAVNVDNSGTNSQEFMPIEFDDTL